MLNIFKKNHDADMIMAFNTIRNVAENVCREHGIQIQNRKALAAYAFSVWNYFINTKYSNNKDKAEFLYTACLEYIYRKNLSTQDDVFFAIALYTIDIQHAYELIRPCFLDKKLYERGVPGLADKLSLLADSFMDNVCTAGQAPVEQEIWIPQLTIEAGHIYVLNK